MSESIFLNFTKKVIEITASLVLLAALTFFLLKLLPGGPFDDEQALNPLIKEKLAAHWSLQSTWYEQAGSYFIGILHGDLGVSMMRPERVVTDIIFQGLRQTLLLNSLAVVFVVICALLLTTLAVLWHRQWGEQCIDQIVIVCLALPSLFFGPFLIYLFGVYWDLLPVAFLSSPAHYILPLLTLSLRPMAALTRILKNSMIENLRQDYVRTARAKGLQETRILFYHVFRNSWTPFLTYLGPMIVSLISGSVLVEALFAIPGLGSEFVSALGDRDYTLLVALTLFLGAFLIVVNSLIDLFLRVANPRLQEKA